MASVQTFNPYFFMLIFLHDICLFILTAFCFCICDIIVESVNCVTSTHCMISAVFGYISRNMLSSAACSAALYLRFVNKYVSVKHA